MERTGRAPRPLAAGLAPPRGRPAPGGLAPSAASPGQRPSEPRLSGLPLPAPLLPATDTPHSPRHRPAERERPGVAQLPGDPGCSIAGPAGVESRRAARVGPAWRRRRGPFHRASPLLPRPPALPPSPAAARVLPERHGVAAFRAGTKGRAAQWARRARGRPLPQPGTHTHTYTQTQPHRDGEPLAGGPRRPALTWDESCYFAERVRAEFGRHVRGAGARAAVGAERAGPGRGGPADWLGAAGGRAPCIFPSLCVCPCAALSRDVTGLRVSFPHKDTGAPAAVEPQALRPHRAAPPPQRGTRGTGGGGGGARA